MTVGIALEFVNEDKSKGIVIVSDRMVSSGDWGTEMPAHKPYILFQGDEMQVMAIGAGEMSTIAEYMGNASRALTDHPPSDLPGVMEICNNVYVEMLREVVKRNYLDPYDITFKELVDQGTIRGKLFEDIQYRIYKQAIPEFFDKIGVLVAGVTKSGTTIFSLEDSLKATVSGRVGFEAIGSGFESADWTLMHRQFNPDRDKFYSLFLGMYAKIQAEESTGVGRDTDAYVIYHDRIEVVPQVLLDTVRKEFEHERQRAKLNLEKAIKKMRGEEIEWKKE